MKVLALNTYLQFWRFSTPKIHGNLQENN